MTEFNYRHIVRLTVPMIASLVLEQLIGFTDIIFLGRVSETAVAASALGGVAFLLFAMLGFGYAVAPQSQMALENGRGHPRITGHIFSQSLYALGLLCLIIFGLSFFAPQAFDYLVEDAAIRDASMAYFLWRTAALPFAFLCIALRAFFIATLQTRLLTVSSAVTVATNCVFNYVLIFGVGPIPALGIVGAAVASGIAEIATVLLFLVYLKRSGDATRYGLWLFSAWDARLQSLLIVRGRWTMLQEAIVMTAWFLFFVWVEHLGQEALAVSNIVRTLADLPWILMHAFAATCGAVAANMVGEGRSDEVATVCHKGYFLALAFLSPVCIVFLLFPEPVLSIFTSIESLRISSVDTLIVMTICFWAGSSGAYYAGLIGFTGATRESLTISVFSAVFYASAAFFLTRITDTVAVVWWSDAVYYGTSALASAWFWRNRPWEKLLLSTKTY